jgi:hypothetical protein
MNKISRIVLLTAVGASMALPASAQYAPGHLIIGFTKGTTDVMFDLGTPSSIGVGTPGTVDLGAKISASLLMSSYNNDLSGVTIGVVGESSIGPSGSQKVILSTVPFQAVPPNTVPNVSAWNVISLNVDSAGVAIDGHGTPPNSAVVDNSAGTGTSFAENITGTIGNTFSRNYGDPTSTTPSPFTSSFLLEDLYSASANGGAPLFLGTFILGSSGTASFSAVPEPTAFALMVTGGLLALGLRWRISSKD